MYIYLISYSERFKIESSNETYIFLSLIRHEFIASDAVLVFYNVFSGCDAEHAKIQTEVFDSISFIQLNSAICFSRIIRPRHSYDLNAFGCAMPANVLCAPC